MRGLQVIDLEFRDRGPCSFSIEPATVMGLHGASGAGKTLLLRALADLDLHRGEVKLGKTSASEVPAPQWRRLVGLLPAESFWWFDRVGEHFDCRAQVLEPWLGQLGFSIDVFTWQVARLSTGEKQRLAIVRLLQYAPRALLLDEPTASLDAANIRNTENLLLDYCRSEQVPLLWVSHDPAQLERVADTLFFLDEHGILIAEKGADHGR